MRATTDTQATPGARQVPMGGRTVLVTGGSRGVGKATAGRFFANSRARRSSKRRYDETAAARLWQVSADLAGLTSAD